jgi:hypothetical protein
MSLSTLTYSLVLFILFGVSNGRAQFFTDKGLFSGSGLIILPTATTAPLSEFNLQYARLQYLGHEKAGSGMNVIGLSAGFSPFVEGYVRLTGEQFRSVNSLVAYGFGGKICLPFQVPAVRRLAFWVEATQSDAVQYSVLFPTDAFRAAAIATFDSNGIRPTLLFGIATLRKQTNALLGAGVTIGASHGLQIGLEAVHGYLEQNSTQTMLSLGVKVLSNISFHPAAGYVSTSSTSTWMMSLGISCSTTGIDFHPAQEEKTSDEFILPSLEEIEKQLQTSPAGSDTLHNGSQDEGSRPETSMSIPVMQPSQHYRETEKKIRNGTLSPTIEMMKEPVHE